MPAFVGNFEDFWPDKATDSEFFSVDLQTAGAHSQHDVHVVHILQHTSHQTISTFYNNVQLYQKMSNKQCENSDAHKGESLDFHQYNNVQLYLKL